MAPKDTNRRKGEKITPNRNSERNKMILLSSDSSSEENSMNDGVGKSQKKEFSCSYCERKFSSSQALGGHQNAHKKERALDRADKIMNANLSWFPPNAWPHYPNGYFSYGEPSDNSQSIPSQNYPDMFHDHQPLFVSNVPDLVESHDQMVDIPALDLVSQRISSPILDNPTSNLIVQLDCKVGIVSSNQVDMIDYVEDPNVVNNSNLAREVESLDLTLKL